MYEIWFDGSCRPKKISRNKFEKIGDSTISFVVHKNGKRIFFFSKYVGKLDNNQAEYEALIYAIKYVLDENIKEVVFYTDSSLLENQINNKYGCFSDMLVSYYMDSKKLLQLIPNYKLLWINRRANRFADNLCKKEFKKYIEQIEGEVKNDSSNKKT